MPELFHDDDPLPASEYPSSEVHYFLETCNMLDRQCDHVDTDVTSGLWRGVDVLGAALDELPVLLGSDNNPYQGPFMEFCRTAVNTKGYRRLGVENELFNLRLKIVSAEVAAPSITVLLQREYAGYDVSLQDGHVVLSRLGFQPEVLEGERAVEIIDDIQYVAGQLLHIAYHSTPVSSKIQSCDLQVPLATSKELAIKPKRNFGMRALRLFRT